VLGQVSRGQITYPGCEHIKWEAVVQKMEHERLFSFTWPHPKSLEKADYPPDYSQEPRTLVEFSLEKTATALAEVFGWMCLLTLVSASISTGVHRLRSRLWRKPWPPSIAQAQHFIQAVCDVSSSQRIQHRHVSLCSDRLEEFIEVGAYSAAVLDVISRSKNPLLRCCHPINITQRNSVWGVAETQTAAFTDRRNDDPVVCERNEQLSDEARVGMQTLSQHPACASKSVPLR
jgi:hypothetical protein